MTSLKGFLLTAHVYDGRPRHQLIFYGVSDQGPFKLIIDNSPPVFFINRQCQSNHLKDIRRESVDLQSMDGNPVDALYFRDGHQQREIAEKLKATANPTYESDVRPAERYLMERFINGGVEVKGSSQQQGNLQVFHNPLIKKSDVDPKFKVLSIDIETSGKGELYSIAFHQYETQSDNETKLVLMMGSGPPSEEFDLIYYDNEKNLLAGFLKQFQKLDPDIILGWHVVGFDLVHLEKKCTKHGLAFNLGRDQSNVNIVERKGRAAFARMAGRVVLDGPPVMRAAFYNFESFKLDSVAHEILGSGKDIEEHGWEKVREIERRFREDKLALAKYNLLDCTLVNNIFKKTELIDLLVTRTKISGMLFNQMGFSAAAFDHAYLPVLHRKGYVAPNVGDNRDLTHSAGGFVLDPVIGLHENVVVLDFRSLYPSIIRTFKIDPLSRVCHKTNPLVTPEGYKFSRTEHILPNHIEHLLSLRAKAKKNSNSHLSQAIKILMNSFYGVMGSGGCRFYHSDLPSGITTTGHWLLRTSMAFLKSIGYKVIYGDTDSVFVKLVDSDKAQPQKAGTRIAKQVNDHLNTCIRNEFYLESHLDLEFEKHYSRFFISPARGSSGGAKKRYAGLIQDNNKETVLDFVGMEIVRSDWTQLAKTFQYELFERLFADEEIVPWIKNFVTDFKNGLISDSLVYKKRLTKPLNEYTKSIPPHVNAAQQLAKANLEVPRQIEYVMTTKGPVPIQLNSGPIDTAHYIEKQIKPLADSVLWIFDITFDQIFSGIQQTLFDN